MLSERAVAALSALRYRPDAEWGINILPFGSIYWHDEMPAMADLFRELHDMMIVHKMFGLRIQLWNGEVLNTEDQQTWDAVKNQVPGWPLFRRVRLSNEQRAAREKAERQVEREVQSLGDDQNATQG